MLRVRDIVLAADSRVEECIKWKTPTFTYEGNIASFNPNTKRHVSLMFHTGAKIPGSFGRLEGTGNTARYLKIADDADAKSAAKELTRIIAAWCTMKDGAAKKRPAKKKAAKKKAPPKKEAAKKKAPAKKKAAKKKAPPKKEAAKKKAPAKKKAAKKKAAKKKAPAKKKAAKKKAPAKKKARAKKKRAKR